MTNLVGDVFFATDVKANQRKVSEVRDASADDHCILQSNHHNHEVNKSASASSDRY